MTLNVESLLQKVNDPRRNTRMTTSTRTSLHYYRGLGNDIYNRNPAIPDPLCCRSRHGCSNTYLYRTGCWKSFGISGDCCGGDILSIKPLRTNQQGRNVFPVGWFTDQLKVIRANSSTLPISGSLYQSFPNFQQYSPTDTNPGSDLRPSTWTRIVWIDCKWDFRPIRQIREGKISNGELQSTFIRLRSEVSNGIRGKGRPMPKRKE